ncbi:hypothetical protein BDR26DRAFT_920753 [Obelidium mucronatum]|nr:hypothetical protein BDR26DRAFT_920753 [Obelidium mucronatum]
MFNFGKSPTKSPTPTPNAANALNDLKSKQLSELKSLFPNLSFKSESVIEVPFAASASAGGGFSLLVTLSPQFPMSPPNVSLLATSDTELDFVVKFGTENYVVVEQFDAWSPQKSLGVILRDVGERIGNALSMPQGRSHTAPVIPPKPPTAFGSPTLANSFPPQQAHQQRNYNEQQQQQQLQRTQMQEILAGLESKSLEELEELLAEPAAFERHLYTAIPRVKESVQLCNDAAKLNAEAAERTLSYQENVQQARERVLSAQRDFAAARIEYDSTCKQYEDTMMAFAPDYLLSRLRAGLQESDDLSDSLVQSMLVGELGMDDFLKRYKEVRKVYHSRAIRVERGERDATVLY